ncbi:MAG: BrnT family toxin [Gammaproteobacteria bacterium]
MHINLMEFEFDPAKAALNLKNHGVSFAHAEQALRDLSAITIEDRDAHGEQRLITLGMGALGRVLVVVHTQREERTRLISARKASPGEVKEYYA